MSITDTTATYMHHNRVRSWGDHDKCRRNMDSANDQTKCRIVEVDHGSHQKNMYNATDTKDAASISC